MFLKAYRYDEDTIFYFDKQDCKHVARKGSFAWRTNNPGLIPSRHSLSKFHSAIGSHLKIAIFPSSKHGMAAFRSWLNLPKYRFSLFEIAKYYAPDAPEEYVKKICILANFPKDIDFKSISGQEFEIVIKAVQCLAGFSSDQEGTITALPKIAARYHSNDGALEFYITGHEEFISKNEAIHRIETHRLDAVVVHKDNGSIYLRSRPGHHLNRIHFSHNELNTQSEFKDAIRDIGNQKPGQCIWGYINGIDNNPDDAKQAIQGISEMTNSERVWSLTNDKKLILSLGNIWDACLQKLNIETEVTKFAVVFFRFLLGISDSDPSHPPIIIFAHSQGAIISNAALKLLTPEERQRLRIYTFGGGTFIFPEDSHPETHNYISIGDLVPRIAASTTLSLLAIRRHEERKQGLSDAQIIDGLISEDVENNLATTNHDTISLYRLQRNSHYLCEFKKVAHITVLDDGRESTWEHSIRAPCYQKKIKELIDISRDKTNKVTEKQTLYVHAYV